jgi:endonuclease/exonuclease/phosphatase (EEP) superfamily protein YafD
MGPSPYRLHLESSEHPAAHHAPSGKLKVISWNLLRLIGARVEDVAALIERQRPDLLLLQEATEELNRLPSLVGGHFYREPMHARVYGLAAWSPHPFAPPRALPLPVSTMPGRVPPRLALLVEFHGITFANVHLSHGQFLNRWQLAHAARSIEGPAVLVGDYNVVGPIRLSGFRDIGPRERTHRAGNVISVRLDRCMARGVISTHTGVLERGPSDHHPILLELAVAPEVHPLQGETRAPLPARVESWLRTLAQSQERIQVRMPRRIKVPRRFAEVRNLASLRRRRGERPHAPGP